MNVTTELPDSEEDSMGKQVSGFSLSQDWVRELFSFWGIYIMTDRYFHSIKCSIKELFCDQKNN